MSIFLLKSGHRRNAVHVSFILGQGETHNWFNPGVGGALYSIISGSAFWGKLLLYSLFYFEITVLVKNSKLRIKSKKKKKKKKLALLSQYFESV